MLTAKTKNNSPAVVVFSISSKTGGVKNFLIMMITELKRFIRQFYIQGPGSGFRLDCFDLWLLLLKDDRYGSVIVDFNQHMRAKFTLLRGHSKRC